MLTSDSWCKQWYQWHSHRSQKPAKDEENPRGLPVFTHTDLDRTLSVRYLRKMNEVEEGLKTIRDTVVGFDMEWPVLYRRKQAKTALIQICGESIALLIHISCMSCFPPSLTRFLEDTSILKAGLNIRGDAAKLYRDYRVQLAGAIELSDLAKKIYNRDEVGVRGGTLQRLIELEFGKHLPKGPVRTGRWHMILDEEQKQYAATDAYASLALYKMLIDTSRTPRKKDANGEGRMLDDVSTDIASSNYDQIDREPTSERLHTFSSNLEQKILPSATTRHIPVCPRSIKRHERLAISSPSPSSTIKKILAANMHRM
ncbi:hypothetical protein BZG36_00261 [Bifiguratus adelaidae]|uniref:3'-5' exonuclease n=1 Tax=Bifiguratus adelaidae TaxID=1938954 RepID=A0A261Y962_9FUNG|nr:hypothetical protein BZG36_00261 [Bifiguratus adelaidae]